MDRLPIELVIHIFRFAAYEFRSTDRGTVVNLALTASFVYNAVAPILHERIVIGSDREESGFSALVTNVAVAARVFKHVTFLCTGATRSTRLSPSAAALFTKVKAVYGSSAPWSDIARFAKTDHGGDIARDLRVWTVGLANIEFTSIQRQHLSGVTRLHTFIPHTAFRSTFATFLHDPTGWTCQMLALLPSLTHLGFSYVDPGQPKEGADSKNLEAYETILRVVAASRKPSVQVMALRLTGHAAATTGLDTYIRIARVVDEGWAMSRMRIWADKRDIANYSDESALMIDDARRERSIWTEAKPFSWYTNAPSALV